MECSMKRTAGVYLLGPVLQQQVGLEGLQVLLALLLQDVYLLLHATALSAAVVSRRSVPCLHIVQQEGRQQLG